MTYNHVATLPFLLDATHLTPEEVAERDANPALWAARRYGQPEHIFKAAAERHGQGSSKTGHTTFLAAHTHDSLASANPSPLRTAPPTATSSPLQSAQPLQRQHSYSSKQMQTSSPPSPSCQSGPSSPHGSSPSGSYFSTILSTELSQERLGDVQPPHSHGDTTGGQSHTDAIFIAPSQQQITGHTEPTSSKKKGKMRVQSATERLS
ncbi:hypothetical protein BU25DRAFT_483985 [Macroventuria anomochaeta]|uniref:Uncharacterized protein n=1 Tax=Macroventuria anomochaeta TaxID=301207 RepID=A0ACB6RHF1_9PLEO|nr:uncharacterized protein BU25DRAFT_483985 [Macroventuria anomochaeta]KAF2621122.1 hypothetical protein BU25DRAFT_483985 [Macroventuria anomochaeta]